MPIEVKESGSIVVSGQHSVSIFRLLALKNAMSLKLKTGMEMSRGVRIFPRVKAEFGLKGSNQKVYDQFCEMLPAMIEALRQQEVNE